MKGKLVRLQYLCYKSILLVQKVIMTIAVHMYPYIGVPFDKNIVTIKTGNKTIILQMRHLFGIYSQIVSFRQILNTLILTAPKLCMK